LQETEHTELAAYEPIVVVVLGAADIVGSSAVAAGASTTSAWSSLPSVHAAAEPDSS
jgi:hypothetical protein